MVVTTEEAEEVEEFVDTTFHPQEILDSVFQFWPHVISK